MIEAGVSGKTKLNIDIWPIAWMFLTRRLVAPNVSEISTWSDLWVGCVYTPRINVFFIARIDKPYGRIWLNTALWCFCFRKENGPCIGTREPPSKEYKWISYQEVCVCFWTSSPSFNVSSVVTAGVAHLLVGCHQTMAVFEIEWGGHGGWFVTMVGTTKVMNLPIL